MNSAGPGFDVGIDIVEISRIKSLVRKREGVLNRLFSKEEIAYCRTRREPWQHFAVRFAAKEAVWKALGRADLRVRDISVGNIDRGKPRIFIFGKPAANLKISLSHSRLYATAVAIKCP